MGIRGNTAGFPLRSAQAILVSLAFLQSRKGRSDSSKRRQDQQMGRSEVSRPASTRFPCALPLTANRNAPAQPVVRRFAFRLLRSKLLEDRDKGYPKTLNRAAGRKRPLSAVAESQFSSVEKSTARFTVKQKLVGSTAPRIPEPH